MDTSSTRSSQPVTRLACNRCHQQKLRCHRSPIPGQPCARCENARVECIFEPPLRPGRPSTRCKSRSKPASPSKSVTASSSATSPRQQEDPSANDPRRGCLSDVDGLFELVASECPMASSNDDQVSLSPFPEPSPDEPLLSLGCRSPLDSGSLYMAPEWLHLPVQTHSSAPNTHSSSLPNGDAFQPTAAMTTTSSSSSSSWSSWSSSSVSTSSLLATADVNFYRLSELNMTLHEYSCQLATATVTAPGAQSDSVVDPPPTITIDQILAVTQSLADILSSNNNNNTPNNNNLHLNHKTLRPGPPADIDFPFHVPCQSLPDGATTLLILSCYLRLLHLYNTALSSPSAVVAPVSPRTPNANGNGIQPLRFQIGCFSTPMTSSMALLACVSSQLLGNLEAALRRLASTMPAASRGDQSWPWEPDAGPASSVMVIVRAAMLEARTLQASLRQRLHLLNSVSSPE